MFGQRLCFAVGSMPYGTVATDPALTTTVGLDSLSLTGWRVWLCFAVGSMPYGTVATDPALTTTVGLDSLSQTGWRVW